MSKLYFEKEKDKGGTLPIFISKQLHSGIKELSMETGIPMKRILERFIEFCFANLEVIENED